jgi:hypothetical protein
MRIAALLAVTAFFAFSQTPAPKPARPKLHGEDWVQLFNGKYLTGWNQVGEEKWNVVDGVIHGIAVTKRYGYLQTDKDYKDFHMSIKFLCEGSGNSGVFFHSRFKPGSVDIVQGLQFEVDCTIGRHTGGIYGDGRNWIVWPSPQNETVVRKGEWNEMLMTVVGNRYTSRLNGVTMIDFTDPAPRSFDGTISLQLHSGGEGNMKFKDIWIRDLSQR